MHPRISVVRVILVPYVLSRTIVFGAAIASRHLLEVVNVDPKLVSRDVLLQWDGSWYQLIARDGYDFGGTRQSLRFFPLYPMLARAVAWLPGISTGVALILISNVAALALGWVTYRLVMQERDDPDLAQKAVWLIYLVPPAYVLVMGYAEALYLVLSGIALLTLRQQRWWIAALVGFLAALTRPVGVLLAIPAAVEGWRRRDLKALAPAAAPALGLLSYLVWVSRHTHSLLTPLKLQNDPELRGGWVDPFSAVGHNIREVFGGEHATAGFHVLTAVVFVGLLYVLFKRWPLSFALYAAASIFIALGSRNLDSFERYGFATLVLVLAGADLMTTPERERVFYVFATGGLVIAATLAFTGVLVP